MKMWYLKAGFNRWHINVVLIVLAFCFNEVMLFKDVLIDFGET